MTEIGATLRETRMRARIDISEIEAKTKIRARYLRALENEEWDLLPGPTFVRSFLRTYAQALGLDDKVLVEEYRMRFEPTGEVDHQPVVGPPRKPRSRPTPPRMGSLTAARGYPAALGVVGVVILLLVIGLLIGGKSAPRKTATHARAGATHRTGRNVLRRVAPAPTRVALSLQPSAAVYVCLIGDGNRKLIGGLIIEPPYTPVTYRAARFLITLGNSSVTMNVDGKPMSVPPSSTAIGYAITSAGRRPLAPGQLPTCR